MGTDQYWSSTEFNADNPSLASFVKMENGYIGAVGDGAKKIKEDKRYGRCVRKI
jgi:hypothetical protein